MDLVECEAPLDNSFQKDRLELVNKGSLGRRRKPSRSNLRLILSPSNDRQIIDVFQNHQKFESNDSFVLEETPSAEIIQESDLDNHLNSSTPRHPGKNFIISSERSEKRTASDNYREVVGSIKQFYSNNCIDLNGNNERIVTSVSNRQNCSKQEDESRNHENSRSECKNKLNSKYHSQFSDHKNHQNGIKYDHRGVSKLSNGHLPNKFNHFCDDGISESQKILEYINHSSKLSNGHLSDQYICKNDSDPKSEKIPEVQNNSTAVINGYHVNKFKHHEEQDISRNQKVSEYKNYLQAINNNKLQHSDKIHQNIITFSNHRQIITRVPVQSRQSKLTNGNARAISLEDCSSKSYIEPSLPRTSKEPSLVEEARQFSVDAKLKRKNSDVQGRSAVLIQTWERRTQCESQSKSKKDSKIALKNRFVDKENCDTNIPAMPDSYICTKYKGSLQNGDKLQKGELISYVRDIKPDETMLYRVSEDKNRRDHPSNHTSGEISVNGNSAIQEPEWISLSRKLCAKFVEGHIESNSSDSYPHEESEGVGENLASSLPSKKNHTDSTSTIIKTEAHRKKVIPVAPSPEEAAKGDEPPWIHLSRKLCNKFIEEHIEYPPITNGHFVEVPELVEPNGDVRIIEKIGKPKGHKSKQKKDCEPEWISLSKKLRAKFIESHIDDPDTIALDNQLNASDPEETSSETLSDISQDTAIPKEIISRSSLVECKNYVIKDQVLEDNFNCEQNSIHGEDVHHEKNNKVSILNEKECCWEYQEMEFDQESNSGNFQDLECNEQSLDEIKIQRISLLEDHSLHSKERVTFSNSYFSRNTECFNNDVNFLPHTNENGNVSSSPEHSKLITVQFIAHARRDQSDDIDTTVTDNKQSPKNESCFNFSSWEVAHYQDKEVDELEKSEGIPKCSDFRSKSLDNLCNSLEENNLVHENKRMSICSADNFDLEKKFLSESELVNKEANENFVNEMKLDYEMSCKISLISENNSCNCTCEEGTGTSEDNVDFSRNSYIKKDEETIYDIKETDSSSEDEVFEYVPRQKRQLSNSFPSNRSGRISPTENLQKKIQINCFQKVPSTINQKDEIQTTKSKKLSSPENLNNETYSNRKNSETKPKNNHISKNDKNSKCNGMIPNSIYDPFTDNKTSIPKGNEDSDNSKTISKEPVKMGMSKWITMSKSEQNISKSEYSNMQSLAHKEQKSPGKYPIYDNESKDKKKMNKKNSVNEKQNETNTISEVRGSPRSNRPKNENHYQNNIHTTHENTDKFNISPKNSDLKTKCISLCDISRINNSNCEETKFRQHESIADLCPSLKTSNNHSEIEYQHFESDTEIPLCAKLVSNHDKRTSRSIPSVSPRDITLPSPCPSDSSHVYEDMFKETPSGPSDSEASWTVLKNNTYYVNGRSSSMNDLDFSDSCSMSVKCDYASSSESSTLQSRHSSYASSSFYVNLRDYDSHMLEPNLNKNKKIYTKTESNGKTSSTSKSSPPTPESLRHLFTSPLTSIHAPPHHSSRMLNRMPSDPQSHYYSTAAAATSSAFKHGFAPVQAKPKKTERSSSIKIKDIAHGIILTFKKLQNHSKNANLPSAQHVDVSHLAELKSNSELGKTKKGKDSKNKKNDKSYSKENGKNEFDSGFLSDVQRAKARRSSSDLTDWKSNSELFHSDKKKNKKKGGNKDKGKKSKSKDFESRTVPTVSRKVQQMADGTLYLVTTVSGDTTMPGVYSDSPDTASEISSHRSVKNSGESNC